MATKKYESMRIMSLEGSVLYKNEGFTATKDGKPDPQAFRGILDESLDTLKLAEVYDRHEDEIGYPYLDGKKRFCRAVVNLSFNRAVKVFESYGNRYVLNGYRVTDEDMQDHVCVRIVNGIPTLIAIDVSFRENSGYVHVEKPIPDSILGKYFKYDADTRSYKRSDKTIPTDITCQEIREYLYTHGFDIDGIHYVRYKRSAGASRDGRCLFIAEPLYADMMALSSCDLSADTASDQASWQAYIALTLSSIESTIKLPKKSILIIRDRVSRFTENVVCVEKTDGHDLKAEEEETEIENVIWDGEALLDASVFFENGYNDHGMMLLRNRFFKTCAFNTNLQDWFFDNDITQVSQLAGYTTARDIKDVKLVITESSVKYLKFMPKDMPFEEKCKRFLDALYEGKNNSEFGVVKADHDAPLMHGDMAYTNYQLLNTLGLTREGIGKLLEPSFRYLQDMLDRSPVLRYQINMTTDHATIAEKELPDLAKYRRDTVLDMTCRTPLFEQTEFYKSFRSDTTKYFKRRLKKGRVAVCGNYRVLFGNAYEFLLALTDASYEPTGSFSLEDGQVCTTGFAHGEMVLCARSPHITMGNLYLARNVHCYDLLRYFNLTPNIICVNAIESNIQQRLNGCDYDSDSMLVTNNEWIVNGVVNAYDILKVPVCKAEPVGKTDYVNMPKSLAKLDQTIAKNKIGEIVNLSQFLNCLLWDGLFTERGEHHPMDIYLSREGIHNIKQTLASDIFRQEHLQIYKKQTEARDDIKERCRQRVAELSAQIKDGNHAFSLELLAKMELLSEKLLKHNGKKIYGYLDKNTKALVKDIVKLLGADEQISAMYDAWHSYKCEIVRTYTDEVPDKIPIEDNEEFKSIRNAVVKSAAEICSPSVQPEREIDYDYSELKERKNDFDYLSFHADFRDDPMLFYRLGRYYLEKTDDMENAEWWLRRAADRGLELASYLVYKGYRDGKFTEKPSDKPSDKLRYLRMAVDKNFGYAEYEYAKYLMDKSPDDAKEYLRRAASHGSFQAEYTYGKMLFDEGKREEAKEWLERSARSDAWTQTRVGLLFYYEYEDHEAGKAFLSSAAEQGYEPAREVLRSIEQGLNARIVIGVCDLFYYASNILDERSEDMYSSEHQIDYHGIDKTQRRENQAKRQGIIMY